VIPQLDGRSLHDQCSDSGSHCGRLLCSTPATQRYMARLCRMGTHEVADHHSSCLYSDISKKTILLQKDRARVRTACLRPIRSVRPKRLPLRPVRPERPERSGVLGLHLLRLVPPNTLVPVLTTQRTCHALIPSEHPPSVSSPPGVSQVDLPDSGSRTA